MEEADLDHEKLCHHMHALEIGFGKTDIGALERRAHATLATTMFLRELHDPDFAGDADADWAARVAHIADALEVKGVLAGMLGAGGNSD